MWHVSQSDTDGYRILNFKNIRIRIGYGYAKIFSYVDQELKNQHPLTSDVWVLFFTHILFLVNYCTFNTTLTERLQHMQQGWARFVEMTESERDK